MRGWLCPLIQQALETARVADVLESIQAQLSDGGPYPSRILQLESDTARLAPVRGQLGQLGQTSAHGIALASLVDGNRAYAARRVRQLGSHEFQRVVTAGRKRSNPQLGADLRHLGGRQRKAGLHDRTPLLEAVGVDLLPDLDVHQAVAALHVGVAVGREQIELVAFLDLARRELSKAPVRFAEAGGEGSPFPTRNDGSHPIDLDRRHPQARSAGPEMEHLFTGDGSAGRTLQSGCEGWGASVFCPGSSSLLIPSREAEKAGPWRK